MRCAENVIIENEEGGVGTRLARLALKRNLRRERAGGEGVIGCGKRKRQRKTCR